MKKTFLILLIGFCFTTPVFAGQQTSGTVASAIISNAQSILNDLGGTFHTQAILLPFVNMGIQDIAAKTRCLEIVFPIRLSSGVSEYGISNSLANFFVINTAQYFNGSTYKGLKEGNVQSVGHIQGPGEPNSWYQSANNIGIYPTPSSTVSGNTLYVYASQRPSTVTISSAIPTPAAYDNALTYYVVSMAFYRDFQKAMGDMWMAIYRDELKVLRVDFEDRPIEAPKEIIK